MASLPILTVSAMNFSTDCTGLFHKNLIRGNCFLISVLKSSIRSSTPLNQLLVKELLTKDFSSNRIKGSLQIIVMDSINDKC